MSMKIYQDRAQTLADLRSSESNYRLSLSKLLGCCTPISSSERQPQSCSANEDFTKIVRKLIAYHSELIKLIDTNNVDENIKALERWCFMTLKIYHQYLKLFELSSQDLEMFRELKSEPLIRLEELYGFSKKLQLEPVLNKAFAKLHAMNEKKLNDSLMALDLEHFNFSNVKDLCTLGFTFAYFNKDEVVSRDFFRMEIFNHDLLDNKSPSKSVELIKLQNQTIAICGMLEIGRDLLYPPLNLTDYDVSDVTACDKITVIHKEYKFQLIFHSKSTKLINDWRSLFKAPEDKFKHCFFKLTEINKSGELGLGLEISQLRKSNNLLEADDSELYTSSLIEEYDSDNEDEDMEKSNVVSIMNDEFPSPPEAPAVAAAAAAAAITTKQSKTSRSTPSLKSSKPSVSLAQLKNQSNVSLPDFTQNPVIPSFAARQSNKSTSDLSSTHSKKDMKIKKRKSIFNLFKSKEPEFEIVSKDTFVPVKEMEEAKPVQQLTAVQEPSSLFEKLNINIPVESQEPKLNESEVKILSECPTMTLEVNDSVLVSQWLVSKWSPLSESYEGNKIQFFTSPTDKEMHLMQITTPNSIHLIKLHDKTTQFTKANALNLQIQYQSHESRRKLNLNLRCISSAVVRKIMNEYLSDPQSDAFAKSTSQSSIFSDNHPSNSTSMSSVSIDQISLQNSNPGLKHRPSYLSLNTSQSTFTMPKMNLSQLSLNSSTSPTTISSISPMKTLNELLLKSQVTVKLHQEDQDKEWIPVSMSKMNIFAILSNEDFFRFDISPCSANVKKVDTIVSKQNLKKLGKTGVAFDFVKDSGDLKKYLIEFRNGVECEEIFKMLSD